MGDRVYRQWVVVLIAGTLVAGGTAGAQEEEPVNLGNFSVRGDRNTEDMPKDGVERPKMRRDSISFESKPDAPQFDLGPIGKPGSPPSASSKKQPAKSRPAKPESSTGNPSGASRNGGASASVEDRSIEPVNLTAPDYPRRAVRKKLNGEVTVAFTVNENGRTEDIEVVDADPPNVFDRAAVRAVRQWTFKPAIRNGAPTSERVKQTIQFDLDR